jgi:transcriptional regulator GlxA family with amidase domain
VISQLFADIAPSIPRNPKRIGFLGFDGVSAIQLFGPQEAFAAARNPNETTNCRSCYETVIIGLADRTFTTDSGVMVKAQTTAQRAPALDSLVIPGGRILAAPGACTEMAEWIAERSGRVRRIISVGTGIYPLAQSGKLDGRRVTTHWRISPDVATRFPKLCVNDAVSFIRDGPFYTCGGGNAPVELALALMEEDFGARVALSVARELVMRLRSSGIDDLSLDSSHYQCGPTDRMAELPAYILSHMHSNLRVEVLAERASLSLSHFKRLFKHIFKTTPADFVEQLRLTEARRQLLIPRNTVEIVAAAVGFKSTDGFRRAFARRFGINPIQFRRRLQFRSQDQHRGGMSLQLASHSNCSRP